MRIGRKKENPVPYGIGCGGRSEAYPASGAAAYPLTMFFRHIVSARGRATVTEPDLPAAPDRSHTVRFRADSTAYPYILPRCTNREQDKRKERIF